MEKLGPAGDAEPTATILPSDWNATALALSDPLEKRVVTLAPDPKLLSRLPSGLYLTSPKATPSAVPATTNLPVDCRAIANARSAPWKKLVMTLPAGPKVGSRLPSVVNRATAKLLVGPPSPLVPATKILPSG